MSDSPTSKPHPNKPDLSKPDPPNAEASTEHSPAPQLADDFARQAEQAPPGLVAEFVDFLIHNKRWWLTPIIIILLLLGLAAYLSVSPVAPFLYPGI